MNADVTAYEPEHAYLIYVSGELVAEADECLSQRTLDGLAAEYGVAAADIRQHTNTRAR